jgi:branched-chain amino acid transport system substrate-binding protein
VVLLTALATRPLQNRKTPPPVFRRRAILPLLLAVALFLLPSCGKREPVRIGFVGGLSGRVADLGIGGRDGAILAVEMRNAAGGISGTPVQLIVRDDRQEPAEARRVVKELLDQNVAAIIGHMTSSMSMETLPLANERKIPMVSPTTTTELLSGRDDYFLRVTSSTRKNAKAMARHIAEERKIHRVAAIFDTGNAAYTESWLNDFQDEFLSRGGTIPRKVPFRSANETDLHGVMKQAVPGAGALRIVANATDTAMLSQQVRKGGSRLPMFTCEWAGTEELIRLGGRAVEGIQYTQFFDRTSTAPGFLAFKEAFLKRFGAEPGFAATASFDAANVVLEALEKKTAKESLKDSILRIGTYRAVQGEMRIDRFGDSDRNIFVLEVRDGQFHPLK